MKDPMSFEGSYISSQSKIAMHKWERCTSAASGKHDAYVQAVRIFRPCEETNQVKVAVSVGTASSALIHIPPYER